MANLFRLGVINKIINPTGAIGVLGLSPRLGFFLVLAASIWEVYLAVEILRRPHRIHVGLALLTLLAFNAFLFVLHLKGASTCGGFDQVGWKRTPLTAVSCNTAFILYLLLHLLYRKTDADRDVFSRAGTQQSLVALRVSREQRLAGAAPRSSGFSPVWLVLSVVLALYSQAKTMLEVPRPVNQAVKAILGEQLGRRDILLKITADCEHCLQYTDAVVKQYPASRIIAVTMFNHPKAIEEYTQKYHIPVVVLHASHFYNLGNKLNVPDGYWIQPTNLVPLTLAKSSYPSPLTAQR